ncbi:MAG: methyltransferase domain-containing protein [Elusimicrobia bacterium]|nr:methyltransferase domain-containing protein [Candidatus Liberimonas magnetica]
MCCLDDLKSEWNTQAEGYDTGFRSRAIARYIHKRTMVSLKEAFKPGMHLLEIGCGTGEEAIALAKIGVRITAIDISSSMIECSKQKAKNENVQDLIDFKVLPAEQINLLEHGLFDGAYSLLGPVNCINNIQVFADSLTSMLKPQSSVVFSVINKYNLWELFYYSLKMDFPTAFRRLGHSPVKVKLTPGSCDIHLWYYTPGSFYSFFKNNFNTKEIAALPLIMPSRFMERCCKTIKIEGILEFIEKVFSGIYPLNCLGDHFLITMNKRG